MKKNKGSYRGIRRPTSGVCQFCLKMISAPNWSRHIKSMHQDDINQMVRDEFPAEEALMTSPEKEEEKAPQKDERIEPENEEENEEEAKKTAEDDNPQNQHETSVDEGNIEEEDIPMEQPLRRSKRNAARRLLRCAIRLPKSNICPICQTKTSAGNWSRHLRRHHPSYSIDNRDSSPPTQVQRQQIPHDDLPLIQLEQFLAQQMSHNDFDLFENSQMREEMDHVNNNGNRVESILKGIKIEDHFAIDGFVGNQEQQGEEGESNNNQQQLEAGTSSGSSNILSIKDLFPQRKIIIRRPVNGICRFCSKPISASNWSRHLRTKHIHDILKIRQIEGEPSDSPIKDGEFEIASIPEPSQNSNDLDEEGDQPMATAIAEPINETNIQIAVKNEITEEGNGNGVVNFEETMAEVIDGQNNREIGDGVGRSRKIKNAIKKSKSAIKLPKSGICPLCERHCTPGNWSRHLKRHHPEYASIEDGGQQIQIVGAMEGVIEGLMQLNMEFVVPIEELRSFIIRSMQSVGTSFAHAVQLAELLIDADLSGHSSFGLSQLSICIDKVLSGEWKGTGEPTILKQKGSTALVDGANLVGAVVGNFCTDLAIKSAKEHGIGWVLAKNSNHCGNGQYYAKRIAQVGMVGMSFANSAPPQNVPSSSSTFGIGKTISCNANSQNAGNGLLVNMNSLEASESGEVVEKCGEEIGFGLGMMLEMFCGVMAMGGAETGSTTGFNSGQCFVAIDPECFAPGFPFGLQNLLNQTRQFQPSIPGDQERINAQRNQEAGGLILQWDQMREMEQLATKCRVQMFPYRQKQK